MNNQSSKSTAVEPNARLQSDEFGRGIEHVCERALQLFEHGTVDKVMRYTLRILKRLRRQRSTSEWRESIQHPALGALRAVLHEDPYTARGFTKPRGYPGDAVLLDYIYGAAPLPDDTSTLGRRIYQWCRANSTAFKSVSARRDLLARKIGEAARRRPGARVLAVACGHLREAALSASISNGELDELVALDQDPSSISVVSATYPDTAVQTLHAGVGDIIKSRVDLSEFDLIYAAGLYDYLDDHTGKRLTDSLCSKLRPGGKLLIANFTSCWEAGYIEAAMSWFLRYRTADQLVALGLGRGGLECDTWVGEHEVISYVEIRKI